MDTPKDRGLRKSFSDIIKGYSMSEISGRPVYIKHFSHHDQVDLDDVYEASLKKAAGCGVPSQSERLRYIIEEEKSWTPEEESLIEKKKAAIQSLIENKRHFHLSKDVEKQNRLIEKESTELAIKLKEKEALMGVCQESFASRKVNEHYILESFFWDGKFESPVLTDTDEMEENVAEIVALYSEFSQRLSEENIKLLAVQEFFMSYWAACEGNLTEFFGKPIGSLTYYQLRLGAYAKIFRNIIQNVENIPDDVKKDPDRLMDYAHIQSNSKKQTEKLSGDAVSMVGATKEDYERMGFDESNSLSLSKELKKSGKKRLSMQDIIKAGGF